MLQSVASTMNLWHDPAHEESFQESNSFFPYYQNTVPHENSTMFKENFIQMQQVVYYQGYLEEEDYWDHMIQPYNSGVFGYWETKNDSRIESDVMVDMEKQRVFLEDTFGLRTSYELGRLKTEVVKGVSHTDWVWNEDIIRNYVLPWLI